MMNALFSLIGQFLYDEAGVTAIEYGLITSLIALLLIGALTSAGVSINELFNFLADCIATPATCN